MSNRVSVASSKASILKIFPLYDDEKTDHISVKNLRRVATDLGEEISEEELQEMIDRADLDRDGLVNFEEFYNILTRKIKEWFKKIWLFVIKNKKSIKVSVGLVAAFEFVSYRKDLIKNLLNWRFVDWNLAWGAWKWSRKCKKNYACYNLNYYFYF